MARTRGSNACDKKKGTGGESPGKKVEDDLLDQEVHKAIQRELGLLKKQLTLEPIQDDTEKQVRLVIAILRMNISALRGTIIHDSGPAVTAERKAAVDRLIKVTSDFDMATHTPDSINDDAKTALNSLSETFKVFGPSWTSIRDSIVQLALEQIDEIKNKDPLQKEKEELERMEKRAKKVQEKEAMERKEREKADKEKKKNKKKKKSKQAQPPAEYDELYDEFGDDRVPPQPSEHLTCRCHHNHEPEYGIVPSDDSHSDVPSLDVPLRNEDWTSTRSRSSNSTFSSDDHPVLSHVMSVEYWSQFCHFYDQGSK